MMKWITLGLQLGPFVLSLLRAIVGKRPAAAAATVETAAGDSPAIALVVDGVKFAEAVTGRDLVNDAAVEPAVREFLRAFDALQAAAAAARALRP